MEDTSLQFEGYDQKYHFNKVSFFDRYYKFINKNKKSDLISTLKDRYPFPECVIETIVLHIREFFFYNRFDISVDKDESVITVSNHLFHISNIYAQNPYVVFKILMDTNYKTAIDLIPTMEILIGCDNGMILDFEEAVKKLGEFSCIGYSGQALKIAFDTYLVEINYGKVGMKIEFNEP